MLLMVHSYLILLSHCFSLVVTLFLPLPFFAVTYTRMLQLYMYSYRLRQRKAREEIESLREKSNGKVV